MKVGILISGRGSNMRSLIDACAAEDFPARIVTVISNNQDAAGLEAARAAGIEARAIDHRDYDDRAAFEQALDDALKQAKVDLICLAGFMRLLTSDFVNRWRNRMINIHPSLLPAFKGLHVHERAIEAGVRFTGCTVHYVRPEMDDGPIIVQAAVPVAEDDTPESLAQRVLAHEHKIYPLALKWIAERRVRVQGQKVLISDCPKIETGLINPSD